MKIKSTKRAFVASALSLLLCASILIGTTFAWFTDSVESGINTIQSGNLDVELYYTDSADVAKDPDSNEWKKVDANTNVFGYNNWEPGFTKVVYFKVENEGSLALKYQLSADVDSEKAGINKDGKEFLLSDYIYTKVVDTNATRDAILASTDGVKIKGSIPMNNAGELEKGENSVIGFAIWMPTDVGNVANHNGTEEGTPQITFGINLIATQKMSENDSFGPDYDEDAWDNAMKVYSAADLKAALANGGSVALMNDITLDEQIEIPEDVTVALNLNGKTLSGDTAKGDGAVLVNNGSLTIVGGKVTNTASNGDATIDNNGTLTMADVSVVGATRVEGGYPEYAVQNSGVLTVEDGTYISGDRGAISIDGNGATTINGGVFTANNINYGLTSHVVDLSDDVPGEHILTINGGTFQHLNEKTSGGVVICNRTKNTVLVNGGSFTGGNYYGNDNLSDYGYGGTFSVVGGTYDAKPANKYIASGYHALQAGDKYQVVPESVDAIVSNDAELATALQDATTDEIILTEGEFTADIYNITARDTLSITGQGADTKLAFSNLQVRASQFKNLTIDNCTIERMPNKSWGHLVYSSSDNADGVYTISNCIFNGVGSQGIYINEKVSGATYNIVDCVFNGDFSREGAITIQNNADVNVNVNVNGCTFNNIPETSNEIFVLYENKGLNLTVDGKVTVANATMLADAVSKGATEIYLFDGEYNLSGLQGKTLTISGDKNVVIKIVDDGESGLDAGCDGATITFNGVTFDSTANAGQYKGFTRMSGIYNDCAFVGSYTTSSGSHKFYNCDFDLRNNYVWTWGASEVVFDKCTFEDANGIGKAILVHEGAAVANVTVRDCSFTASTAAYTWNGLYVAAVSIDPTGTKQVNVNFEGTNTVITSDGAIADANGNTGFAGLHQIKNANTTSTITVKVDGTVVENIVATDYNPNV